MLNESVGLIVTFEYDRLDRIRKFCTSSTGNCHVFSYVGDSDWVSVVRDEGGNLRYRYLYANGRPLRVDIPSVWTIDPWYFVYNARGDWAGFVDKEKSNALGWKWSYGAWGDMSYQDGAYYTWNAEWGYMQFSSNLIAMPGDVLEGFYFAHGRWYMADIGLWLSPWDAGDYWYGGHGQDPVNVGWATVADPWWEKTFRYIHSPNYGWIDLNHFGGWRRAAEFLTHLKNGDKEFYEAEHEEVRFSPDGCLLAWGDIEGTVHIINAPKP